MSGVLSGALAGIQSEASRLHASRLPSSLCRRRCLLPFLGLDFDPNTSTHSDWMGTGFMTKQMGTIVSTTFFQNPWFPSKGSRTFNFNSGLPTNSRVTNKYCILFVADYLFPCSLIALVSLLSIHAALCFHGSFVTDQRRTFKATCV